MTIKTATLLLTLGASVLPIQAGAAPEAAPKSPPRRAAPAKADPTTVRLAQVRRDAAGIKRGTPRSLVLRLFPQPDGGLTSSGLARYYAGDCVLVDVPYDDHGGAFNAQNRVSGPLHVYRGSFHVD